LALRWRFVPGIGPMSFLTAPRVAWPVEMVGLEAAYLERGDSRSASTPK
jgi:hypothetical protein